MKRSLLVLPALAASLAAGAPAQADPPPWAPAHGQRTKQTRAYRYIYYPARQVYYSTEQQLWFWISGDQWQFGVDLPSRYRIHASSGIQVDLHSHRPYTEHDYVERRYGRPWREAQQHQDKQRPHPH